MKRSSFIKSLIAAPALLEIAGSVKAKPIPEGIVFANGTQNLQPIWISEKSTITGARVIVDNKLVDIPFNEPITGQGLCYYNQETGVLTFDKPFV